MSLTDRASEILREAEGQLRSLVSEAAVGGDYASVVQIASWAREITAIVEGAGRHQALPPASSSRGTVPKGKKVTAPRPRRKGTSEGYPRFYKNGDRLVRVAWSKRDKAEYEHKAPYGVLAALSKGIAEVGENGKVFSMEQLLPLRMEDGGEVPGYQAYVSLALLKQVGLLDQHGRQGYSVPRPEDLLGAVEAVWRNLPTD